MRMYEVTCTDTRKGHVTIPKRVRKQLGVSASDKVSFVIHDSGRVEVLPVRYTIESLKGIVPALAGRETEDFDDLIAEAFELGSQPSETLGNE